MREIEFRGKALEDDDYFKIKAGQWLYGNLSIDKLQNQVAIEDTSKEDISLINIDPETVGQYTGRYDKNGTKIFEGDIIKTYIIRFSTGEKWEHYHIVMYDEEGCINPFCRGDRGVNPKGCEVIGNIYDNPELLEQPK